MSVQCHCKRNMAYKPTAIHQLSIVPTTPLYKLQPVKLQPAKLQPAKQQPKFN